ncbi:MAG: DinB family protein [Anaerolineae bacterium]|nr:DinB family protein [Anaerolineae bacterium]
MNWTELIKTEIETTYAVTEALLNLVDADSLDWKPSTGSNWMTVGQLLHHLAVDGCGAPMRGFVTGDWGMPPEGEVSAEEMLSPADKLPSVDSVAQAKTLLAADKELALEMLARCSEADLANKPVAAPWNPTAPKALGYQLLQMVWHLGQHKGQLFYYLKLQGKPVHTGHLWGM